jgi:hypothetical protein
MLEWPFGLLLLFGRGKGYLVIYAGLYLKSPITREEQ